MGNWQLAPRETDREERLNINVEEYFSMFSAHGSNGEGNVMQNQGNGEDNCDKYESLMSRNDSSCFSTKLPYFLNNYCIPQQARQMSVQAATLH